MEKPNDAALCAGKCETGKQSVTVSYDPLLYKLVPIEPVEQQLAALDDQVVCCVEGYRLMVAAAPAQPAAVPDADSLLREGWRAAITLSNNVCVEKSDRYNADDEILEARIASECASEIARYVEPDDVYMSIMRGNIASAPAQPVDAQGGEG